ncbi:nucleoside hydrolase [Clostridium estertheticum]|uniref:nucleoside hydrolase n=1 Tax=Clostridium estertheticum TaxID=238834 RepID=UPI001CF57D0C|nr:nucleoside hydrolase [Clostridium estertheticum]MCB2339112.1 nucleoside hydrolase [Clostridium estertheticum]
MEKIILDVDPGHDDAIAILLAAKNPNIELVAITVVSGNQTLEKTTKNALDICSAVGINNVPVAAGMSVPMIRKKQVVANNIHGESGLDGPHFGKQTVKLDSRHAVDLIIEILLNSNNDITLVPTGPLSNIAMAMKKEPLIVPKIKQIVLMGGSYQLGNVTPSAEFNIHSDAEAAQVVFSCGRPIVMMGLDLTRQALATIEVVNRIKTLNNTASNLFVDLMEYFRMTQKKVFGYDSPPVHDPTTVAYLIDPTIIQTKPMNVEIETSSELTYGKTVCDYYGNTGKEPNALVATKLDFDKFWNLVYDTLKLY